VLTFFAIHRGDQNSWHRREWRNYVIVDTLCISCKIAHPYCAVYASRPRKEKCLDSGGNCRRNMSDLEDCPVVEFRSVGPATEKDRRLNIELRWHCTNSWSLLVAANRRRRRYCRWAMSEIEMQCSITYYGLLWFLMNRCKEFVLHMIFPNVIVDHSVITTGMPHVE